MRVGEELRGISASLMRAAKRSSAGRLRSLAIAFRRFRFSAYCAESLAEACRVAKLMGDLPRYERYERALVHNIHFLMSLQYTSAKTQHFVEKFRPSIHGAFHASHQDGNIRIDYTQHSLCAMVQYLEAVVE